MFLASFGTLLPPPRRGVKLSFLSTTPTIQTTHLNLYLLLWCWASRSRFILLHCVELFYCLVVGDAVSQLWYHFFMGRTDLDSKYMTLRNRNAVWSLIGTFTFGLLPAYMIQLQYVLFAIIWVGIGWSKPEDWPPYFHYISEVTTVRRFWGKYWHQTLRRPLSAFARGLVDSLGFKRGTNLSSYT